MHNISRLSDTSCVVKKLIYTAITNGIGYVKTSRIICEHNVKTCSHGTFDKRSTKFYIPILNAAVNSCNEEFSKSNNVKIASFARMWNSVRNAPYCIIDLIDVTTGKVIDFQIVTRFDLESVPNTRMH